MSDAQSARQHPAAVLWDMDGTIVDTEAHWIAAADEIARSFGITVASDALAELVGTSLTAGAELMRGWGVDVPVAELVERHLELALRNTAAAGFDWRPGAVELLAALRADGIRLALVTMSYRTYADTIIAALPAGTFDVIVTGDAVERGKPHPDAYLRAAELLGVEVRDCVAIEDSLIGLAAARAAGAQVLGIPHHVAIPTGAADVVWSTLEGRTVADLRLPLAGRGGSASSRGEVRRAVL
ncbi:HAD family phosphatase [Microbacterium sp.]|uniref:HAD family hydrolase n=1 Tax=Microbacterium sp. TaxID=51671 RepID=UPI00262CB9B8|nr:HAD family phosphatase [Microbacterium sp.]